MENEKPLLSWDHLSSAKHLLAEAEDSTEALTPALNDVERVRLLLKTAQVHALLALCDILNNSRISY
jgi:hypothetical protein